MEKITGHIYISEAQPETDRPCLGYIQGSQAALLVDAGNSPGHVGKIRKEMSDLGLAEPNYIVLTHSHWDHTYGLCAWKGTSYAGKRTNEYLTAMSGWGWSREEFEHHVSTDEIPLFCKPHILLEYPDPSQIRVKPAERTITEETQIDLGGLTCRIIPTVSPHTDDNTLVYIPEEKFLFTGDAACSEVHGEEWIDDRERLTAFIQKMDELDFTHCVSGHFGLQTKEALIKELKERLFQPEKS